MEGKQTIYLVNVGYSVRFLVLGCNGMAGHTISIYLKEKGHDIVGFARNESEFVETIIGDAKDQNFLKEIVLGGEFDSVVNCIGILNRNAENNKSEAVFLNSYLPHFLEDITRNMKAQIIHISTDCVFSGEKGDYAENDLRDGRNFYDRSKALGELQNKKDFTIRTSIIGPDMNPEGIGLLNWFMQQRDCVWGYLNAIWTGMTTLQLAKCIEFIAEEKLYGLYNVVPLERISKYELLMLCNDYLRNGVVSIRKSEEIVINKSLRGTAFNSMYKVPDYKTMIKDMAFWIEAKGAIYPHYRGF